MDQKMTEHPPRKPYSLSSREKQSTVSNYVHQVVRNKVCQEQERHYLTMKQTSNIRVGNDRGNQQQ